MPETDSFAFSSTESIAREAAKDPSWAKGKEIIRHTSSIGLDQQIKTDRFDPLLLLEAMEKAKDAWDPPEKGGNLIKVVDYRDSNWKEDQALEVILTVRQHTFNREIERIRQKAKTTKRKETPVLEAPETPRTDAANKNDISTERGEVRIKSGIKGLTWSLASSSGDTANYDTNPDNLIYEYTSETKAGATKERTEIPAQTKGDEAKVIENAGVKEIRLDGKVHVDCTEKPRIVIGGHITDSSYYELSPNSHDAEWLNVQGARYLEPAVLALSVEGPSVIPHPLSDRRVVLHYRDRNNHGKWKSLAVIDSTGAQYDVQQKEIAQITAELNPENFWFDVAPSNRSNDVTGYEIRFTDFGFGEGETKITGLDLVVNEGHRTRVN